MTTTTSKLLYTTEEAGSLLGIGRTRMFRMMEAGEIGSVKIGKSRRIPAAALDAYVARLVADHGTDNTP